MDRSGCPRPPPDSARASTLVRDARAAITLRSKLSGGTCTISEIGNSLTYCARRCCNEEARALVGQPERWWLVACSGAQAVVPARGLGAFWRSVGSKRRASPSAWSMLAHQPAGACDGASGGRKSAFRAGQGSGVRLSPASRRGSTPWARGWELADTPTASQSPVLPKLEQKIIDAQGEVIGTMDRLLQSCLAETALAAAGAVCRRVKRVHGSSGSCRFRAELRRAARSFCSCRSNCLRQAYTLLG